jgi:hypothetical protein
MLDWITVIISPGVTLKIPKDHHRFQIFALVACDFLWPSRNKAYHENLSFDALLLSRKIIKVSLEHMAAWKNLSIPIEEKWMPPPPQWFKINFDTAIQDYFSTQAAVCQDHLGHIIKMDTKISSQCLPNMGEALAANLAVSLAISLNMQRFILEGDSQIIILALQHPNQGRSHTMAWGGLGPPSPPKPKGSPPQTQGTPKKKKKNLKKKKKKYNFYPYFLKNL